MDVDRGACERALGAIRKSVSDYAQGAGSKHYFIDHDEELFLSFGFATGIMACRPHTSDLLETLLRD